MDSITCILAATRSPCSLCVTNHPFVEPATNTMPSKKMNMNPAIAILARLDITIAIMAQMFLFWD